MKLIQYISTHLIIHITYNPNILTTNNKSPSSSDYLVTRVPLLDFPATDDYG